MYREEVEGEWEVKEEWGNPKQSKYQGSRRAQGVLVIGLKTTKCNIMQIETIASGCNLYPGFQTVDGLLM